MIPALLSYRAEKIIHKNEGMLNSVYCLLTIASNQIKKTKLKKVINQIKKSILNCDVCGCFILRGLNNNLNTFFLVFDQRLLIKFIIIVF